MSQSDLDAASQGKERLNNVSWRTSLLSRVTSVAVCHTPFTAVRSTDLAAAAAYIELLHCTLHIPYQHGVSLATAVQKVTNRDGVDRVTD